MTAEKQPITVRHLADAAAEWTGRPVSEVDAYIRRLRETNRFPKGMGGRGGANAATVDERHVLGLLLAMHLGDPTPAAEVVDQFAALPLGDVQDTWTTGGGSLGT